MPDALQAVRPEPVEGPLCSCGCGKSATWGCKGLYRGCYLKAWHAANPGRRTIYKRAFFRRHPEVSATCSCGCGRTAPYGYGGLSTSCYHRARRARIRAERAAQAGCHLAPKVATEVATTKNAACENSLTVIAGA